jgi:endonuclease YncB( thermonuclease family)
MNDDRYRPPAAEVAKVARTARTLLSVAALLLSHFAVAWLGYKFAQSHPQHSVGVEEPRSPPVDKVLDGDTVVRNGIALHVLGIDAPELGPWANCWAEAALAGHAKHRLESVLLQGTWKAIESDETDHSLASVEFVRDDGETVRDLMVVYGYAAETAGRWEWCSSNSGMQQLRQGDPAPHGPNLWWPSGPVFDPRADD